MNSKIKIFQKNEVKKERIVLSLIWTGSRSWFHGRRLMGWYLQTLRHPCT